MKPSGKRGVAYLQELLRRIAFMGGDMLGGILYAAWPDRISSQSEREAAREKSLQSMRVLAETAENLGITLCLEIVNRFEQFIMNTASEGAAYLKDLERCCQSAAPSGCAGYLPYEHRGGRSVRSHTVCWRERADRPFPHRRMQPEGAGRGQRPYAVERDHTGAGRL